FVPSDPSLDTFLLLHFLVYPLFFFFFFNDPATTEIYTLSLHDALPICRSAMCAIARWPSHSSICGSAARVAGGVSSTTAAAARADRKSTRLNSSHLVISYAVFCLKKKKKKKDDHIKTHTKRLGHQTSTL